MSKSKNFSTKETFDLAVQNHKNNNLDIAEKLYKEILEIEPNHFESICYLGTLFAQIQNFDSAKQLLQNAIKINPDHSEVHYNLGNVLKECKEIKEAKNCYEKAIQINPKYVEAYNNLGNLFKDLGKIKEAKNCYEKAIQINPNYIDAYNNLGLIFRKLERLNESIKSFQKAIQINPNYANAYNNLGLVLHETGEVQKAIDAYKQAIKINPNYIGAHNNLGNVLNELKEFNNAIACFQNAIKIQPDYIHAYNNLGNAFRGLGNNKKAVDLYKKAIQINPNFTDAYYNLGIVFKKLKKYQEAISCFLKDDSSKSKAQLLECTYFFGNLKLYQKKLEELVDQDPLNIRVASMAAYVSQKEKIKNIYPFCKNPLKLVFIENIKNQLISHNKFSENLLGELKKIHSIWEPASTTTTGGYQTYGNLFERSDDIIIQLKKVIEKQISIYKKNFESSADYIILNWPSANNLRAWYVKLTKKGHQKAHIHPTGWLSGVFYIKIPKVLKNNEGSIRFQLYGYDYPADKNLPSLIHSPKDFDLVLFPSSLFHETIPFTIDDERHCIAFDLVPKQEIIV